MESEVDPSPSAAATPVCLRDALCALTALNQDLVLLEYGNVIIRRDYQNLSKVRILGGGVANKDVAQATFVGRGMFTAAILGEDVVPSSRSILRTIRELNEGDNCGIFVIVQANADLFNFALAMQRANSDCRMRVKLLTIDDDKSAKKERYSCGYIFLTKILGAMAEEGALYHDIYKCYEEITDKIVTVSLHYRDFEHGSRRRKSIVLHDFENKVQSLIDKRSQVNLSLHPSVPLAALINISKTLDRLDELGLVKQVIERFRQLGVCLIRIYCGYFVSAVHGTASLTILKVVDKKIIQYLDASTDASGWHDVGQFLHEVSLQNEVPGLLRPCGKQQIPAKGPQLTESQTAILVKAVQFACDALTSCERQLNVIDAEKSDGNVGARLASFAENVRKRLNSDGLPTSCPHAFLKKMGIIAESTIAGTMGSIYGIFFEGAANVFEELPQAEAVAPSMWTRAFTVAVRAVEDFCDKEIAAYSMFLPLKCGEVTINKEIARGQHYLQSCGVGVGVAEEAAQQTKLPGCKYSDAGAHAVGIWMRALFEGVKLMTLSDVCEQDNT